MWIEVISVSVILLLFVWLLLLLVLKWKLRKLRKNYDGEKDLSKIGEEKSRKLREEPTGIGGSEQKKFDVAGLDKPEGRGILPTASPTPAGKDSKSTGGFFGRRKRKLRK